MNKFFSRWLPLLVWIAVFCNFAAADENIQKNEVFEVETITVTAEKKAQNIQDVPMSMSVFSENDLEDLKAINTYELLRHAPNVYLRKDSNQNFIIIRGISNFYGSRTSPAGFYVDDVAVPLNGMHNLDLVDIERIEILKGPQGSLYGRNSESGVVNVITKQPGNNFEGKAFGEYSWFDTDHGKSPGYRFGGNIGGPVLKDKLFLRVSGQFKDLDGFIKNEFNNDENASDSRDLTGRVNLRWKPSERWDVSLIGDIMDYDKGMGLFRYTSGDLDKGRHSISYDSPYNEWIQKGNGQTLRIGFKGDSLNFTSITGRRYYKNNSASDLDCSSMPFMKGDCFFEDKDTTISQEIRLDSAKNESSFEWLAGIYLFDENTDVLVNKQLEIRDTTVDTSGYAFFGQGTFTIFDKLHLTAGIRFDFTELDGKQIYTTNSEKEYSSDSSYDEILPKFSASYDFNEKIMTYVTIAKGFLHGGYNYSKGTEVENFTYDGEYSWNYEAGAKTSWLDNRLIANFSLFYIEMKDKQVAGWDDDSIGGQAVQVVTNAANAYSYGGELEIKAKPYKCLDFFIGAGVVRAEIDDWVANEYNKMKKEYYKYDYNGKKLPNVPEYTYNLGVQYSNLNGFFTRTDFLGTGKFYNDAKNSDYESGYTLVNFSLGYRAEKYDISLWCKNIFDEEYNNTKFGSGDYAMATTGAPRMFGATLSYRF